MKKKLTILTCAGLFLFLFLVFTLTVKTHSLDKFDFNVTSKIQYHVPRLLDTYLSFFSLIGSFEILFILLLIILFLKKKIGGFFVVFIFLSSHVVEIFGKALLRHPGPPFLFFRYTIPFLFPSSYVQPGSSYPSGHSFRIVFLAVILAWIIAVNRKIQSYSKFTAFFLLTFFTIVMLTTRISLGEHWATDVIGGALFGAGTGVLSLLFL